MSSQRLVAKVDTQGYFLEDVLLEDGAPLPASCIESRPPAGFHSPRWAVSEWVEGKPEAEIVEDLKAQKIDAFARLAVDDLRPYVTGEHGDREMLFVVAKHVKALFDAQGMPADPRLTALIETGDKAMSKLEEVEAAATVEELEGIEWEETS
jgi:hypothetical protein